MAGADIVANLLNGSSNPLRTYQVVVAATQTMGIGYNGYVRSWEKECSHNGEENMGKYTPEKRPLPGRLNVVLTRSGSFDIATAENVVICGSMTSALELLAASPYCLSIEKVFVIGGGQILKEALNAPECDAVHITEISTSIECDTFMPPVDHSIYRPWYSSFPLVENNILLSYVSYIRVRQSALESVTFNNGDISNGSNSVKLEVDKSSSLPKMIFEKHKEYMYLKLVQDIISNGIQKDDRTGTGTLSKFGCQVWSSTIGLTDREDGDLGPIYGFQWRHFGARYTNMHADYTGQGFDQLLDVIEKVKNKPDDRRIILSAWNPADLKLMALPPCHMFAQFYVANGELSCQMYQRSADLGLGVPFNIASYALLTCMIAHVCDVVPGDFIHVIGDAHVYKTHVRPLQEQLQRLPKPFPILKINPQKKDIDSFTVADLELIGYYPHQKIEMQMAI
ncbi:hypothetical protein IFM89_016570 [Coptis chinensis]|uniref:Thymidylate synthase n=1 Tax=Coptis chinensis TaxID=261450 RepID=A0A835I2S4_9MAGN|nr:hypothetical protein IFM89_016570 [Coptis chinensis]